MTLVLFLLILSVLIMIHELGHFVVAKRSGILVEEFGFGLPPRLWGKRIGETIYSINLLPIGGFVKLFGEDGAEQLAGSTEQASFSTGYLLSRAFFAKKKRVRVMVIVAGVIMNFLLGVVLFSIIYSAIGVPTQTDKVSIIGMAQASPAEAAGIKLGEVVLFLDGVKIDSAKQLANLLEERAGQEVELLLGEKETMDKYGRIVKVTPRENPPKEEGALGIVISATEMKHFPWWQMPVRGAWFGLKEALVWGATIVVGIFQMVKDLLVLGVVPKDVAGPVGIYQLTETVAREGWLSILQFVGILSVNLAVLNVLPLPALDGGRLVFLGVEAVTGKRVKGKFEHWVHVIGMALLLSLMLLVTLNDIVRITGAGTLRGLLQKLWVF